MIYPAASTYGAINWKNSLETGMASIASALTSNGEYAFVGKTETLLKLK